MSESMPDGVYNYLSIEDVDPSIAKYWHQRHRIFSKYNEGVWMTDDAWFGVTPEPVAREIATHMATAPAHKTTLIDAFAGAGGNVIAFALSGRWKQIFAVEKDAATLACAKHNAELYGVSKKIFWIHGDVFDVLKTRLKGRTADAVVFASPPWGGPTYSDSDVFDLTTMEPYTLDHLYTSFSKISSDIALYLPRTSDLKQLAKYVKGDGQTNVTHYCIHGASKALCIFYGAFDST